MVAEVQLGRFGVSVLNTETQPSMVRGVDLAHTCVDTAGPASDALYRVMVECELEGPARARERRTFVEEIESLFKLWLESVPESLRGGANAEGHTYVFGSVLLDLQLKAADIDMLCVCSTGGRTVPVEALRDFFFDTFPDVLKENSSYELAELLPVTRAIVPVIKITTREGIQGDVAFAVLKHLRKRQDIDDERVLALEDMDMPTAQSLSGIRNGTAVYRAIPNHTVYWVVARAIKLWAAQRQIYGSIYGYLGGGAVALMVSRECQMYPRLLPSEILVLWLRTYVAVTTACITKSQAKRAQRVWDWKSGEPDAAEAYRRCPVITTSSAVHDNTHLLNDRDLMHVVNPVYPHTNNTRNMLVPHLRRLRMECIRALRVLANGSDDVTLDTPPPPELALPRGEPVNTYDPVVSSAQVREDLDAGFGEQQQRAHLCDEAVWTRLVATYDFFGSASLFLEISLGSDDTEAFNQWKGFFVTRLRMLPDLVESAFQSAWPTLEAGRGVLANLLPEEINSPPHLRRPAGDYQENHCLHFIALHLPSDRLLSASELDAPLAKIKQTFGFQLRDMRGAVDGPVLRFVGHSKLHRWVVGPKGGEGGVAEAGDAAGSSNNNNNNNDDDDDDGASSSSSNYSPEPPPSQPVAMKRGAGSAGLAESPEGKRPKVEEAAAGADGRLTPSSSASEE